MIQLDVLRGVAILLVLASHRITDPPAAAGWLGRAALWVACAGWTGVDLFFVLSGFLIGGLLLSEFQARGHIDLSRFVVRRIFKIWPGYYLLVLTMLVVSAQGGWVRAWHLYLPNLLNVQNYIVRDTRIGQTWSLAVEEHFYIALPLVIWALLRVGPRARPLAALPWIAVVIVLGCNVIRWIESNHRPYSVPAHQFPTHLRMDSLAFGVLLAYWYHFHPRTLARIAQHRWILLILGIALVAPMTLNAITWPFIWTIGYTMLYLGYGGILVAAVFTPLGADGGWWGIFFRSRFARALATVGIYSYSIYLWHYGLLRDAIAFIVPRAMPQNLLLQWIMGSIFYVGLSIAAGIVMAKLVEFPALALRERLFPRRSTALSIPHGRDQSEAAAQTLELVGLMQSHHRPQQLPMLHR